MHWVKSFFGKIKNYEIFLKIIFHVLCNYFMTTFLNYCNSFRLWYQFTCSIISVSVKKNKLKNNNSNDNTRWLQNSKSNMDGYCHLFAPYDIWMCQPIRKTTTVKIQSMLYRLKRQTYFQIKDFFKVKTTVKDMNDNTIDLPKGKNFFAEFVFTILTLVRNSLPQNISKSINQKP